MPRFDQAKVELQITGIGEDPIFIHVLPSQINDVSFILLEMGYRRHQISRAAMAMEAGIKAEQSRALLEQKVREHVA